MNFYTSLLGLVFFCRRAAVELRQVVHGLLAEISFSPSPQDG